jgi:hypothetical protein
MTRVSAMAKESRPARIYSKEEMIAGVYRIKEKYPEFWAYYITPPVGIPSGDERYNDERDEEDWFRANELHQAMMAEFPDISVVGMADVILHMKEIAHAEVGASR